MDPSDISVLVDGQSVGFSFLSPTGIRLDAPVNAGQIVEIKRTTVKANSPVDFTDGSVLREVDLDKLAQYSTFAAQEALDTGARSVRQLPTGDYSANGFRISNVATPVEAGDAVNLGYIQTTFTPAMDAKMNAAATSANTAHDWANVSFEHSDEAKNSATTAAVAQQAAQNAQIATQNAQTQAVAAKTAAESVQAAVATSATSAASSATAAANSKTAAANSQAAAATSATAAATSATNAATSASNAASSAAASAKSATDSAASLAGINDQLANAKASATAAATSATNAKTSETNAAGSATTASTQASAAGTSANAAMSAKTAAVNAQTAAQASQTAAETAKAAAVAAQSAAETARDTTLGYRDAAKASQDAAAASASSIGTSASAAAASATNAANSESNVLANKNAAAASASAAATSATNAANSASAAAGSASGASSSATAAATSKTNAATSESNALASKNAAATSATNAATSATNSANSATAAATSASNAKTSETNAANSASQAAASAATTATMRSDLAAVGGSGLVGYKHFAAGTSARTSLAKMNDMMTLLDFGAATDQTTDSSAAVLRALAVSTVTYVPEGYYVVTPDVLPKTAGRFTGPGFFKVAGGVIPVDEFMYSTTLNVPSQFATIQAACDYVAARYIHANCMVVIKVADGVYNLSQVNIQFHQGDQVQIIGNQANKAACVLNFDVTGLKAGFSVWRNDHMVNLIDGFVINGIGGWNTWGQWNTNVWTAAFEAWGGGQIIVGSNIEVHRFYYGVRAQNNGFIYCQSGVRVYDAGDVAFFAFNGGVVEARNCFAKDAADSSEGLGFGFLAEQGGSMICNGSTAETCNKAGFATQNGGAMWAHSCTATGNVSYGFFSNENGSLEAHHCTATGNFIGYEADMKSYMNCYLSVGNNNKSSGFEAKNLSYINANSITASNNAGNGVGCYNKSLITGPINGTGNAWQLSNADASSTLA